MIKRLVVLLIVALSALVVVPAALADGILIPVPPRPWPTDTPMENLAIRYHRVRVTIKDQVATTEVDQVFVNTTNHEIEAIYMFPLPDGSAISDFAMYVDGAKLDGTLLDREEARRIYENTVRQQRDPALLEYVGRNAFRARIYPIPAKGEKRIVLRYSELLRAEGGLVRYLYPLDTERLSSKPIEDVSIHVDIRTKGSLKAIYSPSHQVAVFRDGEHKAEVGYEERLTRPDRDFELYYSIDEKDLAVNLLSYKEPGEDGFFLLLAAPKVETDPQEVIARDVIIVLDVSGSMRGAKIQQAKDALSYILDHLNDEDRFNIITFSTGTRRYARRLADTDDVKYAKDFVDKLAAGGGTNIDRALSEALEMAVGERPQIVIFLTDGLATEGVVATEQIIANVAKAAPRETRLFTFGIGDEVNTLLLDTIAQSHRGASAYVRPHQSIAEEVGAFYAKIGSPVLADMDLDFGDVLVEDAYPDPLPDLFVGSQLVMVGRYRDGARTTIRLHGVVNGKQTTFVYPDVRFTSDGGPDFIPVLWATRKIGYLLTQVRLNGESKELVDEIVDLSVRYGIMTPYTAFLVDETADVLTEEGRERTVEKLRAESEAAAPLVSGKEAVERSVGQQALQQSDVAQAPSSAEVKQVGTRAFVLRDEGWVDTGYDPDSMKPIVVNFGSDAYFDLVTKHADAGKYLSTGQEAIVVLDGQAYQIVQSGGQTEPDTTARATATSTVRPTERPSPTPTPRASDQTAATKRPNVLQRFWQWVRQLFE